MKTDVLHGKLVLLMAPSGSGKGTLIRSLDDLQEHIYFAKTYTSRPRRKEVTENPLYTFVSSEEFKQMIEEDAFIEWAEFGGNYYGTPKTEIIPHMNEGKVVFKEMELQGIVQMKTLVPVENITVIYIDAGGWESLQNRITARSAIDDEELSLRKERYEEESKVKNEADIIIKNLDGGLVEARSEFRNTIKHMTENVTM